jgi:hypothetical protein
VAGWKKYWVGSKNNNKTTPLQPNQQKQNKKDF